MAKPTKFWHSNSCEVYIKQHPAGLTPQKWNYKHN